MRERQKKSVLRPEGLLSELPGREVEEAVGSSGDDPGPLEDAEDLVLERELQLADRRVLRQLPVPLHVVFGPLRAAQT